MTALTRNVCLRLGLLSALTLVAAAYRPVALHAASPVASLDIVPDDAAFYSAMLRNREQFDVIAKSKAWAKIQALPGYQWALGFYQMQAANPGSPAGYLQAALNNPESRKSLDFLADIFSDEVFVYGGPSCNKFVELYQTVYWDIYMSGFQQGIEAARQGKTPPRSDEMQARILVRALSSQVDNIVFPDLVIGLKCKDKDFAKQLLDKLEANVQPIFAGNPMLAGRFKRETVGGHDYLTLTLEGGMVPWDPKVEEKIREFSATPADADKLIDHLKKLKLVVSLGLRDDFLIVALGPTTDALARLGKSPLAAREELAAVKEYAAKRLTSVSYTSKTFNRHFRPSKADIDKLATTVKSMIPPIPEEFSKLRGEIEQNVDELARDLKSMITEIGATASVGFLTNRGTESFSYDWSEHPEIDCSKPLDLLKHIGGNPIAVVAGRGTVSVGSYDMLVKWVGIISQYIAEYAGEQADATPVARQRLAIFMPALKSLAGRVDKAIRKSLLPALADGQSALVIDAKLTSRQFIKAIPPTEQAMPMIEPAIVVGVSDAPKLKEAFTEFYAAADDFVEELKRMDEIKNKPGIPGGPEIPKDFKLPRPKEFNLKQGKLWGYALPKEAGVDSRVMPNAGVADNVAVLSMSGRHTQRLLGESDPVMAGIKLPTNKAYGTVAAFDFTALLDAAAPWIDMALAKAAEQGPPDNVEMIKQHAKTGLEVLRCYHGTVAVTYQEGKITITRSRSEFKDLEE